MVVIAKRAEKKSLNIFYGWWIVAAATAGQVIAGGVSHYGLSAFFQPLLDALKCDRATLSGAFSLKNLESGLLGPIDGFLVDRFGPRKIVAVGAFMAGLGFFAMSFINSLIQFYGVIAIMACGLGLAFNVAMQTAVANWFRRKRGLTIGIFQSGMAAAVVAVPLISITIIQRGFRFAALAIAIFIWVVTIPIVIILRDSPEPYGLLPDGDNAKVKTNNAISKEEGGFTVKEALATPAFWILSIAFSLRLMVTVALTTHLLPYLVDIGFNQATAAVGLGSVAAVSCLGRLGFGWLGDRISKKYVIAGLMGSLILSLLFLTQIKNVLQMFLFIGLYAPSYGGLAVLMQSIRAEYFGRKAYGSIMGYMNLVSFLGTFVGPIFAGWVWERTGSYKTAFLIFAATTLVALLMMFFVRKPKPKTA
ncbi:MAG: MFS transporter [Chloroflexota bacterium]